MEKVKENMYINIIKYRTMNIDDKIKNININNNKTLFLWKVRVQAEEMGCKCRVFTRFALKLSYQ